ncbi:MAG: VWA domain-containing protein [Verrucomicrobia bacterium]|nr:VWA domain-containing protein [Verrucomicrobiota bacterium]
MRIEWLPILPVWTVILVIAGLLGLLGYGCVLLAQKKVPQKWIAILASLRTVIIVVFALCLFQPIVSCERTKKEGPAILMLLDTSQSMGVKDSSDRTRLEETLTWLQSSGLRSKLANASSVYWFAFDQNARQIEPGDLKNLQPTGETTRYAESLSTAWDAYRQISARNTTGGAAPGRVFLIGDGNDLGARDIVDVAHHLGVAIDTLAPVSGQQSGGGADVAITLVQSPRRILYGSESRFLVTLRQEGMANRPLTLNLKEGGKTLHSQNVTFSTGQEEKQVSLTYRPTEIGIKQYEFEIVSNPPDSIERNNHDQLTVQVVGNKNEVLFIEDSWRWEFKFLRRIFEDDPSFTLSAFLARGGNAFIQFAEHERRVSLGAFPQTRAELERFDTLVLGDVNPKRWPKPLIPAIHKLVVEEGKSLIFIAGPNIATFLDVPEITTLLPVEITAETAVPRPGPVAVKLSAEAHSSPLFFNPPSASGMSLWANLPPVDQIYPPLRKRPAATILVEAAERNDYGALIVVAEHTVGQGRVLYVGTDTLWKWHTASAQTDTGGSPYTVFWQQALRALAPSRLSTGAVDLWLQPDRSKYETGQNIQLRAEIRSEQPLVKPKVQADVTLPDDKQIPLDFSPHPTQPGIYQAQFEAAIPGQHKIIAKVISEGKKIADVVTAIDVQKSMAEMNNIRVNEANLARIAGDTGGRKIDRNNPKTWPTSDNLEKISVKQNRVVDLWNNFTLLILLALLLATDWLFRLLRGYV